MNIYIFSHLFKSNFASSILVVKYSNLFYFSVNQVGINLFLFFSYSFIYNSSIVILFKIPLVKLNKLGNDLELILILGYFNS